MSDERIKIELTVSLHFRDEEKVRGLVAASLQEQTSQSERSLRAILGILFHRAKIEALSLSPQSEQSKAELQKRLPADSLEWTLDPSRPSFMAWDDGLSLEIPPAVGVA